VLSLPKPSFATIQKPKGIENRVGERWENGNPIPTVPIYTTLSPCNFGHAITPLAKNSHT